MPITVGDIPPALPAPRRASCRRTRGTLLACSGSVHDEHYKRLFAFPRMVEDLLRGFVAGDWIDEFDFTTLQKLSADYVSDERRTRRGDTVWQVRHRSEWLHVLVLLEFQSTDDPDMALRILEYTALLIGNWRAMTPWDRTADARRCCRSCSTTARRRGVRRGTSAI